MKIKSEMMVAFSAIFVSIAALFVTTTLEKVR